ncbi:hypothetical protein FVE85_3505 [Porphyridium purpureum]|uniref:Uncharacterized protein n=1 Tax=Porphyridium purpureum TaxID=35688 RepID=A0A5J4YNT8_PORPP|nr:hypothetical protein FVE85_3505 [Porphyridium purpureum]|eukprot:POR0410..scf249_10
MDAQRSAQFGLAPPVLHDENALAGKTPLGKAKTGVAMQGHAQTPGALRTPGAKQFGAQASGHVNKHQQTPGTTSVRRALGNITNNGAQGQSGQSVTRSLFSQQTPSASARKTPAGLTTQKAALSVKVPVDPYGDVLDIESMSRPYDPQVHMMSVEPQIQLSPVPQHDERRDEMPEPELLPIVVPTLDFEVNFDADMESYPSRETAAAQRAASDTVKSNRPARAPLSVKKTDKPKARVIIL